MKRLDLLKAAPLGLLAACAGSTTNLLTPSSILKPLGKSGSGSGCQFQLQQDKFGIRLNFDGCNNGRSGYLNWAYLPKEGLWDSQCQFFFYGSPPQQHWIQLGDPPDPKWAKQQIIKLFHKYFMPNGDNGGTLVEYDGTPIVDMQFHVTEKRYVATNYSLAGAPQYQGTWGSGDGPMASNCTSARLAFAAAVIAEAIACIAPGIGWLEIVPLAFAVAATGIDVKNECRR